MLLADLRLLFGVMICLPAILQGAPYDLSEFKPSWYVGQTWHVQVETLTVPPDRPLAEPFVPRKVVYGYDFKVEAVKDVQGERCCQVRIDCATIDGSKATDRVFYRVFCRTSDQSLKMLQRVNVPSEEAEVSRSFRDGPVDLTDWVGFLPSGFPVFAANTDKYAPRPLEKPDGVVRRWTPQSWQKSHFSGQLWVVNGAEKTELDITLLPYQSDPEKGPKLTEGIWLKGMPWWLQAEHTDGDRPPLTAKLVRIDGLPVTAARKPQIGPN